MEALGAVGEGLTVPREPVGVSAGEGCGSRIDHQAALQDCYLTHLRRLFPRAQERERNNVLK